MSRTFEPRFSAEALLAALADPEKGAGRVPALFDQQHLRDTIFTEDPDEVPDFFTNGMYDLSEVGAVAAMLAGVSSTGLAVQLLECDSFDAEGNPRKSFFHVVNDRLAEDGKIHTLITGEIAISEEQVAALAANGITYVNRDFDAPKKIEQAINDLLAGKEDIAHSNITLEKSLGLAIGILEPWSESVTIRGAHNGKDYYQERVIYLLPEHAAFIGEPNQMVPRGGLDIARPADRENLVAMLADSGRYLDAVGYDFLRPFELSPDFDVDRSPQTGLFCMDGVDPHASKAARKSIEARAAEVAIEKEIARMPALPSVSATVMQRHIDDAIATGQGAAEMRVTDGEVPEAGSSFGARLTQVLAEGLTHRVQDDSVLERVLRDGTPEMRAAMADALAERRGGNDVSALEQILRTGTPELQAAVADALAERRGGNDVSALERILRDGTPEMQAIVADVAAERRGGNDVSALEKVLRDGTPELQAAMADALAQRREDSLSIGAAVRNGVTGIDDPAYQALVDEHTPTIRRIADQLRPAGFAEAEVIKGDSGKSDRSR